ncbi:MAG: hypothetical protein CK424_05315 [Legionella sp.]|nr:MAG: hypothetical protein CK424_05315 [Legionella sp.]
MKDIKESFPFLAEKSMFQFANTRIPADSYAALRSLYEEHLEANHLGQANLLAQKLSILYGFKGLYLYLPLQLSLLEHEKNIDHEMIGQALIKVLSLLFFIEKNASPDSDNEWINTQKEHCYALFENDNEKREGEREAHILSDEYQKSVSRKP